jgi:hypothetical protein
MECRKQISTALCDALRLMFWMDQAELDNERLSQLAEMVYGEPVWVSPFKVDRVNGKERCMRATVYLKESYTDLPVSYTRGNRAAFVFEAVYQLSMRRHKHYLYDHDTQVPDRALAVLEGVSRQDKTQTEQYQEGRGVYA